MMKATLRTRLLGGLLVLLGFGTVACDGGTGLKMYGTPEGEFEFKAKVVDQAGTPMAGVQVVQLGSIDQKGGYYKPPFDSPMYLKTDGAGCAARNDQAIDCDSLRLFLHDPAGRFADTVCRYRVQPSDHVEKGDGHWKWGKVSKTVEIKVHTKQ